MKLFLINILLALFWTAVTGFYNVLNFAFGFFLGAFALYLIREQTGATGYFSHARRIISLFALFLYELAISAIRVAMTVLRPNMNLKPGIFAYRLQADRDFEITLLANLITLTPGTLSVDVSPDRKYLYIHAINCSDLEAMRNDIFNGFERRILEAFR